MKYHILMLTLVILLYVAGCKKDDLPNSYVINATIKSRITNEGIPNARIFGTVRSRRGNSAYVYYDVLDTFSTTSDANGNISFLIRYDSEPGIVVSFNKADDAYSTSLLPLKTEFALSALKQSPPAFYVRRYVPLVIGVQNTNPFDDQDAISVSTYQQFTDSVNNFNFGFLADSIQNFGVQNQPYDYPAVDNGKNPYWIGKNVNSVIYARIEEGAVNRVTWSIRKNGLSKDDQSAEFTTSFNNTSTYDIKY